jgi:serine/threonine protein kinase
MDDLVNTYLGQYWIIEIIGRGSTSIVYKAYQPSLDRYVAIKVLLEHLAPHFETRFTREARAIAHLQHPNILTIYDFVQQDPRRFFVLQYVENGTTLANLLPGAPVEPVTALRLVDRVLAALEYAHKRGIIHRDVKPSNLLMPQPDWPLLADFGIARLLDDTGSLTPAGQVVGTAAYMAPELAHRKEADARTDLYATAVVLYELVTGQVPFDAKTPIAVLMKHMHEPLPLPSSRNPHLPPPVEALLLRALAKDPDRRYQTAAEMREAVRRTIFQVEQTNAQQVLANMLGKSTTATLSNSLATLDLPLDDPPPSEQSLQPANGASMVPTLEAPLSSQNASAPRPRRRWLMLPLALLILLALAFILRLAFGADRTAQPTTVAQDATALPTTSGATSMVESPVITPPVPTINPTAVESPAVTPPLPTSSPPSPSAGGAEPDAPGLYTVQAGDTLSEIAERFGTTVEAILASNGLTDPDAIEAGQTLVIPAPGNVVPATTSVLATTTNSPPSQAATATPIPTAVPATPPPAAEPLPNEVAIRLEDTDWQGGYRRLGGRLYGGRTATWIYGSGTEYNTMRAVFDLGNRTGTTASLSIEGMDSEDRPKTPIRVSVNGVEIYNGPNPLPNDDLPLETGTWTTYTFAFDAALLRPGQNQISISNLAEGVVGLPPFFMLDYADIQFER